MAAPPNRKRLAKSRTVAPAWIASAPLRRLDRDSSGACHPSRICLPSATLLTSAREVLDDLVREVEELEGQLIHVDAFVIERHREREGEREREERATFRWLPGRS